MRLSIATQTHGYQNNRCFFPLFYPIFLLWPEGKGEPDWGDYEAMNITPPKLLETSLSHYSFVHVTLCKCPPQRCLFQMPLLEVSSQVHFGHLYNATQHTGILERAWGQLRG